MGKIIFELGKNADKEPIDVIYSPEFSERDRCSACNRIYDLGKAYFGDSKCPYCGQPFNIKFWYS